MDETQTAAGQVALIAPDQEAPALEPIPPKKGSRRPRNGISVYWKFFLALFLVLMLNMVIVLAFGNTMLENFYCFSKEKELQKYAELINSVPTDALADTIYAAEQRNIEVLIFEHEVTSEGDKCTAKYYTRSQSGYTQEKYNIMDRIYTAVVNGVIDICDRQTTYIQVDSQESQSLGWVRLYRSLGENNYLMLETPMVSIIATAEYATQFLTLLSLATLLVGGVVAFLVARQITRPIRRIDEVAQRLTVMDFSQRCEVRSHDEVGRLAESVNRMADRLRENIDLLQQRNELLRRDLEREEVTNRQRRDFIASVSHDFKTPLSLIEGYAETMEEEPITQEQREYCQIIVDQASRVNGMINHLLSLSRLESRMITLKPTVFAMEDLCYSVLTDLRILLEKRGMKVEPVPAGEWYVNADYAQMEQVVTNLVENAIKYSGDPPVLRIHFERVGGCVRTAVFNSALPIPEEMMPHLFEGFYRADQARQQQSRSYGLGLAIVKAIVELHGCGLGVRNLPGGVEFWFDLPAAELLPDPEEYDEDPNDLFEAPDGTEDTLLPGQTENVDMQPEPSLPSEKTEKPPEQTDSGAKKQSPEPRASGEEQL